MKEEKNMSFSNTICSAKLLNENVLHDLPNVLIELPHEQNGSNNIIKGKSLIIWHDKNKNKKRDFIDTDQITPASYCVSKSIETLDENWKEGTFKYLMPDFRQHVHEGRNFLIVGERFGIGSSREMSPAGLKAIAEEKGLNLVIICGSGLGDIFRKNAINLGLYVLECPQAVEEAQEEDEFEFNNETWALKNLTQNKLYSLPPFELKEENIRRQGGIFYIGKKELYESIHAKPEIIWPDEQQAQFMTTTEQIIWAHRVDTESKITPGQAIRVYADLLPVSDGTAPFSIYTFNKITGGNTIYPRQAAIINDHFTFTGISDHDAQVELVKDFAKKFNIKAPYYGEKGAGIFHFYFPEKGLIIPGGFYPGADSHSRTYGAYGALGVGVGSTTIGFGWANGYIYFTPSKQRRVTFTGKLQPWTTGKDIVLALLKKWGNMQAQNMSIELVDINQQLSMNFRHTIANMMAEAEALNGIFALDEITLKWYEEKKINLLYPILKSGINAVYDIDETFDLTNIIPQVARPFHPSNTEDIDIISKEKIIINKAFIGSCTNGSYVDLLQAALIFYLARNKLGISKLPNHIKIFIYPGSGTVKKQIEYPDSRLNYSSIAEIFRGIGAFIRHSWCGPCIGQGQDALIAGEKAVTTFNRNWQNRMGLGGEGYLASPMVVAASALLGYIGSPVELGFNWQEMAAIFS